MSDFQRDVYILSEIKRYSTSFTLRQESVAEHGFYVAAIVLDLHTKYHFDLGKAAICAISHDIPELELNDASWALKKKYPKIAEAFDECEAEVVKSLPRAVAEGVHTYHQYETTESLIVHLADAMQCRQFTEVEMGLGNFGYMKVVYDNSQARIKQLQEELKDYER